MSPETFKASGVTDQGIGRDGPGKRIDAVGLCAIDPAEVVVTGDAPGLQQGGRRPIGTPSLLHTSDEGSNDDH